MFKVHVLNCKISCYYYVCICSVGKPHLRGLAENVCLCIYVTCM